MTNVTPINPELPVWIGKAVEEQQTKVWRLRSLLDVLREAVREDHDVEDSGAAVDALVEYADQIHLALDESALKARAAELENEKRQEADTEARGKLLGGEESPDDGPVGTVQ